MKKFFLFVFIFCAGIVAAQDNSFLLYSIKGNVSVVENKTESKAKVGKIFYDNATIKVPSGAAVTLICNETAMFTIKKAGSYTLNNLKDSCYVSNTSVSANYVKYVWNQMTKSSGSPGSNRKAFMNTVGAVSRSVNNIWIDPRLDTVNYVVGDFPLSWKSYSDAKDFEFSLFNKENLSTAFFKTTIGKLKIQIPKFITELKPGNTYYWTAAVQGEQNEELKVFNYVEPETFAKLLTQMKSTGGAFESEAEQAYRLAFMLEDAHYLAEAYNYYVKAALLQPDLALYRSTLMSFKKDYEIK